MKNLILGVFLLLCTHMSAQILETGGVFGSSNASDQSSYILGDIFVNEQSGLLGAHSLLIAGGSVSIEEIDEDFGFRIYPNPSTGDFRVTGTETISQVGIIDVNGQIIKSFSRTDFIDLGDLPSGAYGILVNNKKVLIAIKK